MTSEASFVRTATERIRSWTQPNEPKSMADVGLLILRLSVGFEFFAHGMQKFGWFGGTLGENGQHITGAAAVRSQADFLGFLGYHPTLALSWFLTFTELGAGLLLMAGFLTPLAAAAIVGDALNLIFGLAWQQGWFGEQPGSGYEYVVPLLAAAVALCLLGPGRYSVDRALGWRLSGIPAGVAGVGVGVLVGVFVLTALGPGFGGADLPSLPPETGSP